MYFQAQNLGVPFSVEVNALLVVDLNQLSSPNDVICNDMGALKWSGSSKRWVLVQQAGFWHSSRRRI